MDREAPETQMDYGSRPLPRALRVTLDEIGPVLMLADHLDATLAMAEDLSRLIASEPVAGLDGLAAGRRSSAVVAFAQQARALELGITARILQARKRAQALEPEQADIRRLIASFVGGTAVVADAVAADGEGLGDTGLLALATGSAALRFLKTRGVVAEDVAVMDDIGALAVGEDYLAAGLIHLGTLMDMVAGFLDALDLAFDLYGPLEPA